jgi:hypothetical protein
MSSNFSVAKLTNVSQTTVPKRKSLFETIIDSDYSDSDGEERKRPARVSKVAKVAPIVNRSEGFSINASNSYVSMEDEM